MAEVITTTTPPNQFSFGKFLLKLIIVVGVLFLILLAAKVFLEGWKS